MAYKSLGIDLQDCTDLALKVSQIEFTFLDGARVFQMWWGHYFKLSNLINKILDVEKYLSSLVPFILQMSFTKGSNREVIVLFQGQVTN